jgi:hypothetical protein
VNSLLVEINFNIHENIVLPKCYTLFVLRYRNKEEDVTLYAKELHKNRPSVRTSTVKNGSSVRTSTVKNGPAERNIHNPRFPKALEVHEDLLKSLSSLVSNQISSKYFGLPNVKIRTY